MSSASDISGDVITRMLAIEGGSFAMACTAVITKEGSDIMGVPTSLGGPAAVPIEGGGFAAIYAPDGQKLAQAKDQFVEETVIADVDMDAGRHPPPQADGRLYWPLVSG